jgi:hypothetical protein
LGDKIFKNETEFGSSRYGILLGCPVVDEDDKDPEFW